MPRTESEPLKRIHLWLYESDVDKLQSLFKNSMGMSRAVRTIVRKFIKQIEAASAQESKTIQLPEVQLDNPKPSPHLQDA